MGEQAINLREGTGPELVDPQAIELGLQRAFFSLLNGSGTPDTLLALARAADTFARDEMVRIKLLKMTTRPPTLEMLRKWGLE